MFQAWEVYITFKTGEKNSSLFCEYHPQIYTCFVFFGLMYFQIVSNEPDSQLFQLLSARWLVFIMNKAMWMAELFKLCLLCQQ